MNVNAEVTEDGHVEIGFGLLGDFRLTIPQWASFTAENPDLFPEAMKAGINGQIAEWRGSRVGRV